MCVDKKAAGRMTGPGRERSSKNRLQTLGKKIIQRGRSVCVCVCVRGAETEADLCVGIYLCPFKYLVCRKSQSNKYPNCKKPAKYYLYSLHLKCSLFTAV